MNDAQVQQFLTIVKYMNMSKAAQELFISQSALSTALSRTEKELGVKLFYRDGKRLILSHAGENLLDKFTALKAASDDLFAAAKQQQEQEERIIIGFSENLFLVHALDFFDFLKAFNGQMVESIVVDREQNLRLLKSGQIDFAIAYPPLEDFEVSSSHIMTTEVVAAVSKNHPFAHRDSLSVEDLDHQEVYLRTNYFYHHIFEVCARHNTTLNPIDVKNTQKYYQLIHQALTTDKPFLTICERPYFDQVFSPGLIAVNIKGMEEVRTISWLTSRKLEHQYKDLLDYFLKYYPDMYNYNLTMQQLFFKTALKGGRWKFDH